MTSGSLPRPVVGLLGPIVVFRHPPSGAAEPAGPARPPGPAGPPEPAEVPARLDRVVLAHLALAEGRAVTMDDLVEALWGEHPPRRARNAVQVKVSRLRGRLGEHGRALVHAQGSYRLALERHQVDAGAFSLLVREAEACSAAGDHQRARSLLVQATPLWRGPPLAELDEHPRLVAARTRLDEEWRCAHELLAACALAIGSPPPDVIARLRDLLAEDPLRPRARLLLMHALDRSGRRAEAIAVYDHGRRLLADQAGLEPAVELRAAFAALLAEERETSLGPRPYAVTRAPPHGALDTARWLAREGETPAALQLALRGSWWWWLGGRRSAGRDLMADLLSTPTGVLDERQVLSASAWLAVFDAVQADAATALGRGEQALYRASALGWSQHDALAALLLAERLFQRGEHARGDGLVRAGRASFEAGDDAWGRALAAVVETKALLLRGRCGPLPLRQAGWSATSRRWATRQVRSSPSMSLATAPRWRETCGPPPGRTSGPSTSRGGCRPPSGRPRS
ncbi:AfsR/SARP family transcriptional regulator [Arsenicicoccus bolidensis]|uniref:AfsR/SARP family transcriptional regulator n=1 Tax=Arsenicicoccus bolidensis TaxID=229480 RepID=UPI0003F6C85A|nr:AfsR/SARP family transcriptional regulator [Arsenicicoccus bolidensis]